MLPPLPPSPPLGPPRGTYFSATERDAAVAAVARFHQDFCFVNKHENLRFARKSLSCDTSWPLRRKKRSLPGQRPRKRSEEPI